MEQPRVGYPLGYVLMHDWNLCERRDAVSRLVWARSEHRFAFDWGFVAFVLIT